MKTLPFRSPGLRLLAALVVPLALLACDRREDGQTVGQTVDRAIERTEQATRDVGEGGREAAQDARTATMGAASGVAARAGDAQITSQVNADLKVDKALDATRIDVDTREGVVTLKGQAPNAAAKARAAEIAGKVKDVRSVDNQLTVAAG